MSYSTRNIYYDKKGPAEYALYHGDDFVDIGTARELSEKYNITANTIYRSASAYRREKTGKGAQTIIFKIEEEEKNSETIRINKRL